MALTESEFKKLLIDLEIDRVEIADVVGISSWAVTLYFRGRLKNPEKRAAIGRVLRGRARQRKIDLPKSLWPTPPAPAAAHAE